MVTKNSSTTEPIPPFSAEQSLPWQWLTSQSDQRSGSCIGMALKSLLATLCKTPEEYKAQKIFIAEKFIQHSLQSYQNLLDIEQIAAYPIIKDAIANYSRSCMKHQRDNPLSVRRFTRIEPTISLPKAPSIHTYSISGLV